MTPLAGLLLILSVVSCEYNADVVVRIPRWESATQPVGVLGVVPRSSLEPGPGPYTQSECEQGLSTLGISFFLADERDQAVGDGDRILVRDRVIHPSAAAMAGGDPSQEVFVDQLQLVPDDGDPVSLMGTVESVAWHPTAAEVPARLVMLHDHSFEAAEHDGADQRLAALSEVVGEALCHETKAVNCPLPGDTRLSLYSLKDDQVRQLQQRTRDYDGLQNVLDDLRNQGELGHAPYFVTTGGGEGGIPTGLEECSGGDSASECWPALVLISGEVDEAVAIPPELSGLAAPARFFGAGFTDSPSLRRLACRTGGFFEEIARPSDLRLLSDHSTGGIPDYAYGFARKVLLAARGRWEAVLTVTGLPADLDMSVIQRLTGTLSVRLGETPDEHIASADFTVTIGGY